MIYAKILRPSLMEEVLDLKTESTGLQRFTDGVRIDDLSGKDKQARQILERILRIARGLGARASDEQILIALMCPSGDPVLIDPGRPVVEYLRGLYPGKKAGQINFKAAARAALQASVRITEPVIFEFRVTVGDAEGTDMGPP